MDSESPHEAGHPIEEIASPVRADAVMIDGATLHDDISTTQMRSTDTTSVSAEHIASLLYQPGYIWDPRSSPQGVEYYPEYPDSAEDETTAAQA